MLARRLRSDDRGFTLVEVLVAIFILLVGVLGVVSMIDGANFATAKTKSREGGTNLAREILDGARAIDYDKLNTTEIVGLNRTEIVAELQKQPGLADSDASAPGWQISRRGIDYTVTSVPVCKVDDPKDDFGNHSSGNFCVSSSTTGSTDGNPDDMRRMDVRIEWSVGAHKLSIRQTTLIINPSGSLGPSVKTFCVTGLPGTLHDTTCPAPPYSVVPDAGNTTVSFGATTSPAAAFHWEVDDGTSRGDATSAPSGPSTNWTFSWDLGTVGTFSCNATPTPDWTLDGNYLVGGQAFDSNGIQGQRKALTITVNRSLPSEPCGLEGGYNDPRDKDAVVELQWRANPERDIVGYYVFRRKVQSESEDPLVCELTIETSCQDDDPLPRGSTVQYYARAVDRDPSTDDLRQGTGTPIALDLPRPLTGDQPPTAPSNVSAGSSGGLPVISWTGSSDGDTGEEIRFYRIYRDGTSYAHRYDKTGDAVTLSWMDRDGADGHTYYVAAVDTNFDESEPTQAVAP